MISNNNTNLNLSYHPSNPCLLLLPRSLMLSPSPPSPLPIHMHPSTFNCHTQTQISSDSTGRPWQTRRFLAAIWIETVLVHFLEWPAENSREMVPWNWKNVVQMIWDLALEYIYIYIYLSIYLSIYIYIYKHALCCTWSGFVFSFFFFFLFKWHQFPRSWTFLLPANPYL